MSMHTDDVKNVVDCEPQNVESLLNASVEYFEIEKAKKSKHGGTAWH